MDHVCHTHNSVYKDKKPIFTSVSTIMFNCDWNLGVFPFILKAFRNRWQGAAQNQAAESRRQPAKGPETQ